MRRRLLTIASTCLVLILVGVGGILFAIKRAVDSRSGPVHRFPVPAGETFLTDHRAVAVGREVMNRDGFPESAWRLMTDDRTKAPDGRPDQFLTRNTIDPNQGSVFFYCADSPTPARYVNVAVRNREITAQGALGK
jgi:hypothetical protein